MQGEDITPYYPLVSCVYQMGAPAADVSHVLTAKDMY